jgi:hypothetical protein
MNNPLVPGSHDGSIVDRLVRRHYLLIVQPVIMGMTMDDDAHTSLYAVSYDTSGVDNVDNTVRMPYPARGAAAWHDGDMAPRSEPAQLVPDPDVPGAVMVRIGGIDQSWVDPNHPRRLEFDYMDRIGQHIDAHAPAGQRLRVIHIGGAGMSLARYVAATRPTSPQIVLEPDAALTAQVRASLPLAPHSGIKVRPVDGRTGIAAMPDDYADIVILDAFADGQVPASLVSLDFLADVARVLHADGALLANLVDDRPFAWTRRELAGIVAVFGQASLSAEPAVLKGRRFGNLVAAGCRTGLPVDRLGRLAAGSAFPYRLLWGTALSGFIAGATPFTDADAEPSPAREHWLTWSR